MLAKCIFMGEIVKLSRVISVALTVLIMSAAAVRFSAPTINKRLMGERKRWSGTMSMLP